MRTSATTKDIDSKPCKRSAFTESLQSYDLRIIFFQKRTEMKSWCRFHKAPAQSWSSDTTLRGRIWWFACFLYTRRTHKRPARQSVLYLPTYVPLPHALSTWLFMIHFFGFGGDREQVSWYLLLEERQTGQRTLNETRSTHAEFSSLNVLDAAWLFQGCKAMKPWRVSKIEFQKLVDVGCWKGYCT